MPEALRNRPDIDPVLEQYLEAYRLLGHYRTDSGTLILENVIQYAKLIGEDPIYFATVITRADRAFVQELRADKSLTPREGSEAQQSGS